MMWQRVRKSSLTLWLKPAPIKMSQRDQGAKIPQGAAAFIARCCLSIAFRAIVAQTRTVVFRIAVCMKPVRVLP